MVTTVPEKLPEASDRFFTSTEPPLLLSSSSRRRVTVIPTDLCALGGPLAFGPSPLSLSLRVANQHLAQAVRGFK